MPLSKIQFGNTGRRNLVINGAMSVAQRGTSTTVDAYNSLDRFPVYRSNMDNLAITWAQDTTVPTGEGFSKSAKISVTTAETALAADELFRVLHRIEGRNMQQASWGTSGAKPLTLSFFVRSNVTGTYAVESRMNGGGSHSLSKTYTISAANTWERKTITFPANTSTAFVDSNAMGWELGWYLAAGTNFTSGSLASDYGGNAANTRGAGQTANIASSTSNTWYITGVQLEVGDSATDFEHRSFAEELSLCQRYYQQITHKADNVIRGGYGHTSEYWQIQLPTPMRAAPTSSKLSGTLGYSNCSGFTYYTSANTMTNNTVTAFVDPSDGSYYYLYPTAAADLVWQFFAEL